MFTNIEPPFMQHVSSPDINFDQLMHEFNIKQEPDVVIASGGCLNLASESIQFGSTQANKRKAQQRIDSLLSADRATIKRQQTVPTSGDSSLTDCLIHELQPFVLGNTTVASAVNLLINLRVFSTHNIQQLFCELIQECLNSKEQLAKDEAVRKLQWLLWAYCTSSERRTQLKEILSKAVVGLATDTNKIVAARNVMGKRFGDTPEHTRIATRIVRALSLLLPTVTVCPTVYRHDRGYAYGDYEQCINGWNSL